MRSIRVRLLVLWVLSLASSLAVGVLLLQLYRQSSTAQNSRLDSLLSQVCDDVTDRYAYYVTGWTGPADGGFDRDLAAIAAIAARPGIEIGFWQSGQGPRTRLPAEPAGAAVAELAAEAVQQEAVVSQRLDGQFLASPTGGIALAACPLPGPVPLLAAWTLGRLDDAPGTRSLRLGLGGLAALVASTALWLSLLVAGFSRRVKMVETALAVPTMADLPPIAATGEPELDRIVAALNHAGRRLAEARAEGATLAARVARVERLAALGRVAAGVAHEIRNPLAAMRLRAESALAGDDRRRVDALAAVLVQVTRLDRLVAELLAMTGPREAILAPVPLAGLLRQIAAEQQPGCRIDVAAPEATLLLDAGLLRRALDNLLANACRHGPPGGIVLLRAARAGAWLRIEVEDGGPGVADQLRATLFEPFVTGHAAGTGLGLAIAREMAEAHGGSLTLARADAHPVFALEVPWRCS